MTLDTLEARVARYLEFGGQPHTLPSDPSFEAEVRSAASEFHSMLLLGPVFTFSGTITGGTSRWLYETANPDVVLPVQVSIGGSVLRDSAGRIGPVGVAECIASWTTAGTPTAWAAQDDAILFNRTPGSNTNFTGTGYLSLLTLTGSESLPCPESLHGALEKYCALRFIEARTSGQDMSSERASKLWNEVTQAIGPRYAEAEALRASIMHREPRPLQVYHGQVQR